MKTKQVRQDILNQWESLAMGFPKLGCLKKNVSTLTTTCRQLSKLHFSTPKMSDILILNWGERLMRTRLIDSGLFTIF